MYIIWPCIGFISNILLWEAILTMVAGEQRDRDRVLWKEHYRAIGIIIGSTVTICAAIFGFFYMHMVDLKDAEIALLTLQVGDLEKRMTQLSQGSNSSSQKTPQQLIFKTSVSQRLPNSYQTGLTFAFSKNEHPGSVDLMATIQEPSKSRIIKFWPIVDHMFTRNRDDKIIGADGKTAHLKYQPTGVFDLHLELEVTLPAFVSIEGSHDLQPFTIGMK